MLSFNIIFYFLSIFFLMMISISNKHIDKICAILIAFLIFYFAAFRGAGHDYQNYIDLVKALRSSDSSSIFVLLSAAKDPLFALIIMLSGKISDNQVLPIALLVLISVFFKLTYAIKFIRYKSLFIGIYGIFIAPGLEFAAIRAAAGLSFILFFIAPLPNRIRYFSGIASIISHIQYLPVVFSAAFSRFSSIRMVLASSVLLAVFTFLVLNNINLIPLARASGYAENQGTAYAVIPALIYLIIFIFSFPKKYLLRTSYSENSIRIVLYKTCLILIFLSIVSSYAAVTISTRLLEIVSFLMLVLYFHSIELRISKRLLIGCIFFLFFLAAINIYRSTWVIFYEFSIF